MKSTHQKLLTQAVIVAAILALPITSHSIVVTLEPPPPSAEEIRELEAAGSPEEKVLCPSQQWLPFPLLADEIGNLRGWLEKRKYTPGDDYYKCPVGIGFLGQSSAQDFETPIGTSQFDARYLGGRVDLLVLPVLDLYFVAADVTGSSKTELLGKRAFSGTSIGGGVLASFAYKYAFASVDFSYASSDIEIFDDPVGAYLFTPRVGYFQQSLVTGTGGKESKRVDLVVYAGASYQSIERSVSTDGMEYRIDEEDPWNGLVGVDLTFRRRIEVSIEGAIGGRSGVTGQIVLRF
jgi:hypothetical protein